MKMLALKMLLGGICPLGGEAKIWVHERCIDK